MTCPHTRERIARFIRQRGIRAAAAAPPISRDALVREMEAQASAFGDFDATPAQVLQQLRADAATIADLEEEIAELRAELTARAVRAA
jgi:hypothetical protein